MTETRDLQALLAEISGFDPELSESIQRYLHVLEGPIPTVAVESYPFGSSISREGIVLRQKGEDFNGSLFRAEGVPFGIIIKGNVEITDYTLGAGPPRRAPQAILKPGDFIGLFEFMDKITASDSMGVPDWTITAGAASICCPFNTSSAAFARHLRGLFKSEQVNEHAIKSARSFLDQLLEVPAIRHTFASCTTDIMYFGADWFEPMNDPNSPDPVRVAGSALYRVFAERAWRALSRIRPSASSIAPFFFGGRGNSGELSRPVQHERHRALNVFMSLYDMIAGRRPMFLPETKDGSWGPIGFICETVLQGYGGNTKPFILRPDYLGADIRVGFMPVESIASELVQGSGAHESALLNVLNAIDAAAKLERGDAGRSILSRYGEIIEALAVRLPAARVASPKKQASFITRDAKRGTNKGVVLDQMEETAFFSPYEIKLEKPGAEFFKTCIRLAMPGPQ